MKKPCDASQTIAESVSTGKRSGELSEWVEKTSVMDGGGWWLVLGYRREQKKHKHLSQILSAQCLEWTPRTYKVTCFFPL